MILYKSDPRPQSVSLGEDSAASSSSPLASQRSVPRAGLLQHPPSAGRFQRRKGMCCVSAIQNLHSFDPFADASKGDDLLPAGTGYYSHIRIQQRKDRKTLSTVQGIADDYDKKKLVKAFKEKFACNGTLPEHPEYGELIQLQGDQRKNICQFLIKIGLAKDDQLNKVHGF
uniref:eukaryotic translation initiation factor 1-like n=1 Tax=Jaculus jaculus TaxID=51337 RepID=UPI001E1B4178|nr:eukaryotic translation initiation factor 1-like [Jaculus jaculus]